MNFATGIDFIVCHARFANTKMKRKSIPPRRTKKAAAMKNERLAEALAQAVEADLNRCGCGHYEHEPFKCDGSLPIFRTQYSIKPEAHVRCRCPQPDPMAHQESETP